MLIFENFALKEGVSTRVTISESQLASVPWSVPSVARQGAVDLRQWIEQLQAQTRDP